MGRFVFGTFFQILFLVSAESNFLQDFFSHEIYPVYYNIIKCTEHESINLIKMLSARFQRFVNGHSIDNALASISPDPQTFILDLRCPESATVLRKANDLNLFGKPFHWILLDGSITSNAVYENKNLSVDAEDRQLISESGESWCWAFLETLNVLADSNVRVVEKRSGEKITITSAYIVNNIFIKEPLAEWTSKERLVMLNSKPPSIRRWNFQGVALRSTIVVKDPNSMNHLEDLFDRHIDSTTKVTYNMVNLFGYIHNASITYRMDDDYGFFVNGSWTGMVGDLERKEIEISAAPLFFRESRFHFIEYYGPTTKSRFRFIFLSPPLSYSQNIFSMPFDTIVWCCCCSMVAVACIFLFAALSYEKSHSDVRNEKTGRKDDSKVSFSEILVLNIGALCQQGTAAETKDPPGRVITLFLYLSYMFLYISYSAAIVAILQSSDTSIQTLSDFLKSPLKGGADNVTYSQFYFRTLEGETRKAIYNRKIAPKGETPHFLSVTDGIKQIRKGFYAFHLETSVAYEGIQKTFTEEEKCGLQEIRESFFYFPPPWAVMKKGTPYAEQFKISMKMAIERGFKSRFSRRYYTEKPVCGSKSSRFVSVGINESYYSFMLLLVGLIISFLVFLCEIIYSKYVKNREKHRRFSDYLTGTEFFN